MHYFISLFVFTGGWGVVVTKGIFPPPTFTPQQRNCYNRKNLSPPDSDMSEPNMGRKTRSSPLWEMHKCAASCFKHDVWRVSLSLGVKCLVAPATSVGCCHQFNKNMNPTPHSPCPSVPSPLESPSPTVNDSKYLFGDVVL